MASSYQDRINARRGTGVNKKKEKKVKPVSKDPRPKQSDIGKKYKNYGEFRQAVLAWKKRNDPPKKKKEYVSPKERKFGKSKLKVNKEIEQEVETYVKKMKSFNPNPVEKVDYPSKTVEKPKNVSDKKDQKDKQVDKTNKGPNLEAANKILSGNKNEVTYKDFQSKDDKSNKKGKESLKAKKYIKKKKGKGFVSTKSARGKQLLKIEERKRKLREKRFGKK